MINLNKRISTFFAILLVISIIAVIGFAIFFFYQYIWTPEEKLLTELSTPEKEGDLLFKERSCLNSGGKIETWESSSFCEGVTDFPYNCSLHYSKTLPPDLFCTPIDESRLIRNCNCGKKKCFNGNECVYDSYIDVLFPKGSEQLVVRDTYQVRWTAYKVNVDFSGTDICLYAFDEQGVKIDTKEEYLCNPSVPSTLRIGSSTLDKGEYEWFISSNIWEEFKQMPTYYKIIVSVYNNGDFIFGESEDYFIITD